MALDVRARIHEIRTASASAAGAASVAFGPVPVHCQWIVDELTTSLSKGTGTVQVNHGPNANAPIAVDSSRIAQANRSAPPGLVLYPGDQLSLTFGALSAIAPVCVVTVTLRGRQTAFP